MKKQPRCVILSLVALILLIALDQWSKKMAVACLSDGPYVILEGVFELRYIINDGAAFGILKQQQLLFLVLTPVVLILIGYFFLFRIPGQRKYLPLNVLCVLIAGGAIGNFIDRLRYGYVVDFLYFKLIDFPVFNVADCYVTISAVLLFVLFMFYYQEEDLKGIL